MRRKLKLSMLEDYIATYQIIYVCKALALCKELNNLAGDINNLKNSATVLQEKYETIFLRTGINDTSFLLLKSQLLCAIKNETNYSKNLNPERITSLSNKLKLLESRHNSNTLKLRFRKIKN